MVRDFYHSKGDLRQSSSSYWQDSFLEIIGLGLLPRRASVELPVHLLTCVFLFCRSCLVHLQTHSVPFLLYFRVHVYAGLTIWCDFSVSNLPLKSFLLLRSIHKFWGYSEDGVLLLDGHSLRTSPQKPFDIKSPCVNLLPHSDMTSIYCFISFPEILCQIVFHEDCALFI